MALNQNVPTHTFGGGITFKANSFPSDTPNDVTYGGAATPQVQIIDLGATGVATQYPITDQKFAIIIASAITGASTVNLPAYNALYEGLVFQFVVGATNGATFNITAGGSAITGIGAAAAVTTAAQYNVFYSGGSVRGYKIVSA